MDYIFAFLCGVFLKLYDDLNDNNLIDKRSITNEVIKGVPWILGTLLAYNDFNYQFLFMIINIASSLGDPEPYAVEYVVAHKILNPFLLLMAFGTRTYFNYLDLLALTNISVNMFLESLLIKEEFSIRKLIVRFFSSIGLLVGILIGLYLGVSKSLVKILCLSTGYAVVSTCFQAYFIEDALYAQYM